MKTHFCLTGIKAMKKYFYPLVVVLCVSLFSIAHGAGVTGHEPSYVSYTSRYGDSSDLDNSLRVHLSFRYDFKKIPFISADRNVFFTYTGDFDFYWLCGDCRESAPVVGRVFNPALHWRTLEQDGRYLELSLHHRSNGQVTNAMSTDATGNFIADTEFRNGNNAYIDSISRSSNFLQLEAKYPLTEKDAFYIRWRPIFDSADSVKTWNVSEPKKARFSDYDRFEFIYSRNLSCDSRIQANWSIGDSGFSTDSLDLAFQYNWKGVPFYLSAHHGPMETLSDHTRSVNSIGVGVVFWDIFGC